MSDIIIQIDTVISPILIASIELNTSMNPIQIVDVGINMPLTAPSATDETAGLIRVGENLKITNGILSVDVATSIESDNTKPVTSKGVSGAVLSNLDIDALTL